MVSFIYKQNKDRWQYVISLWTYEQWRDQHCIPSVGIVSEYRQTELRYVNIPWLYKKTKKLASTGGLTQAHTFFSNHTHIPIRLQTATH